MKVNNVQRIYTFNAGDFEVFPELGLLQIVWMKFQPWGTEDLSQRAVWSFSRSENLARIDNAKTVGSRGHSTAAPAAFGGGEILCRGCFWDWDVAANAHAALGSRPLPKGMRGSDRSWKAAKGGARAAAG
jgi:hypothetical protein